MDSPNILLVDDEEEFLAALSHGLVDEGLNVLTATDGDEALQIMKRLRIAALALTLAATPCLAGKVYIDYDKDAEWGKYKTWDYRENPEGRVNDPLMQSRLEDGLLAMMRGSALKRDQSDPDVLVTFTVTSKDRTQYNTVSSGFGYGYPRGWGGYRGYGWGGGVGVTSSTSKSLPVMGAPSSSASVAGAGSGIAP